MKRSAATSVAAEDSFAGELDRRVAERTAELNPTIEQLRIELAAHERAEEALRDRATEAQMIWESIPGPVALLSPTGEVEGANRQLLAYFGQTLEELRYWGTNGTVHSEDLPHVVEVFSKSIAAGVPYEIVQRLRRSDGVYRWFQNSGFPIRDGNGKILRWCVLLTESDDLKKAEEALQLNERNLSLIINTIPTHIYVLNREGFVQYVNQAVMDYTGLSLEDVKQEDYRDRVIHPGDFQRVRAERAASLREAAPFSTEQRVLGNDGQYRWFLVRYKPLLGEEGRILRWYVTAFDIEDRKQAEALLAGEKQLLEMVASDCTLPDILDALCRFVEEISGRCYCSIYLIDAGGTKFHNAAAPSLPSSFNDPVEGALVDRETGPCGMAACLKTQVIASDIASDQRWPASVFRPLALANGLRSCWSTPILSLRGKVLGTFAIYQNEPASPTPLQQQLIARFAHIASIAIERAHGEAALKRSEALLEEAQHLSSIGSFSWRVGSDQITWSDQLYRIYEFEPGVPATFDLIRTRVHPEDLTLYERMVEQARNGAEDFEWQYRLLLPDQSIKYLHAVARATRNDDGQLEYIAAVQDITRRRLREEELRRSEAFLAEGQHLGRMGNFWWCVRTNEILWSEPMYRIYEFEPETTMTLELIAGRVHPDDMPLLSDMIERAEEGKDFEYEHRIVMPGGSVKYLHLIAHRTRDDHRGPEYIGAVQDVTQRRLSEEALGKARSELARMSRVMSLGTLTAAIAHEVNQPLSGIITNASTCVRMLDADPANVDGARETARRTIRDGRRAAEVVTRLRALFARKDTVNELVDLNEATREVIALSRSELERNRVITKTELAEPLPLITGDRVQLQQVIHNLLRNGSDAMAEIDDRPRELWFRTEIEGDHVRFSVQDAGIGLAGQSPEQLFQSFYTTKKDGMGIGLSVSRSIIENHQGRLWATPNEGPGVTFSFSIPCLVTAPGES
jgi:PAS domain S-box-containing protein